MYRVSFIFHLNAFKGFAYFFCWPRGRGIGLVCTRRFSFHKFYNFLLFNFLIFIFFGRPFFLPTTFTHTHTHDPRPLPTTHDPRHLATLSIQASNIKWQSERNGILNFIFFISIPFMRMCRSVSREKRSAFKTFFFRLHFISSLMLLGWFSWLPCFGFDHELSFQKKCKIYAK